MKEEEEDMLDLAAGLKGELIARDWLGLECAWPAGPPNSPPLTSHPAIPFLYRSADNSRLGCQIFASAELDGMTVIMPTEVNNLMK